MTPRLGVEDVRTFRPSPPPDQKGSQSTLVGVEIVRTFSPNQPPGQDGRDEALQGSLAKAADLPKSSDWIRLDDEVNDQDSITIGAKQKR